MFTIFIGVKKKYGPWGYGGYMTPGTRLQYDVSCNRETRYPHELR